MARPPGVDRVTSGGYSFWSLQCVEEVVTPGVDAVFLQPRHHRLIAGAALLNRHPEPSIERIREENRLHFAIRLKTVLMEQNLHERVVLAQQLAGLAVAGTQRPQHKVHLRLQPRLELRLGGQVADDVRLQSRQQLAVPLQRAGLPYEMGRAVVYFASPDGDYTTGAFLRVDGGLAFSPAIGSCLLGGLTGSGNFSLVRKLFS